ncbi:MAG TPA: hypothetical protein VIX35_08265 [Vicinamibacterales bacterium]
MRHPLFLPFLAATVAVAPLSAGVPGFFAQGDLIVTRSVYQATGQVATIVAGQALPFGGTAVAGTTGGPYPSVFQNDGVDASFGVTSPIFVDEMTPTGTLVRTFDVPTNQMVNSFSSKSEMAIGLSQDGTALTFVGYAAPLGQLDVSNSNTPNHVDPTNLVTSAVQRVVGQLDLDGTFMATPFNGYSGNNGRAAVLTRDGHYLIAGNAGNGSGTEPLAIIDNTGVQIAMPGGPAESTVVGMPTTGTTTPATACVIPQPAPPATEPKNGCQFGFNVQSLGDAADKSGKDDNFRSTTVFNNTLYVTKGSGSNGIDTVYQVGAQGSVPTLLSDASTTPITIVPGFPTTFPTSSSANRYPFATWFANATTMYVADEGNGNAAPYVADPGAGLEKWILNTTTGTWSLAYTLQAGLNLGVPYTVPNNPTSGPNIYPNPFTDGLRQLAGRVNRNGKTVNLYAVTSTVSTAGDQGADPNKIVAITDDLSFTTAAEAAAAGETFTTLRSAVYGEVLRGVAVAGPYLEIHRLTPTPAVLWPPNHKFVPVTIDVHAEDIVDASPSCKITSITSNEGTSADYRITGALTADLLADRVGNGGDRFYRLTVSCSDNRDNTVTRNVDVIVPHDHGGSR